MLIDVAADAREFGRRAIFERPVGLNLVAKGTQKLAEVGNRRGELRDGGPFLHCRRRTLDDLAPFGSAIDYQNDVADFIGFEGGAGDAGFVEHLGDMEKAGKFEASFDATEFANFGGEMLLIFDPGTVLGRRERGDAASAQRR